MKSAKVFMNGRSQAIRLPREFRVKSKEVYFKRTPEVFLVTEKNPWELYYEGVAELSDEFFKNGREQLPLEKRSIMTDTHLFGES
jgi:antitoxin VapB